MNTITYYNAGPNDISKSWVQWDGHFFVPFKSWGPNHLLFICSSFASKSVLFSLFDHFEHLSFKILILIWILAKSHKIICKICVSPSCRQTFWPKWRFFNKLHFFDFFLFKSFFYFWFFKNAQKCQFWPSSKYTLFCQFWRFLTLLTFFFFKPYFTFMKTRIVKNVQNYTFPK